MFALSIWTARYCYGLNLFHIQFIRLFHLKSLRKRERNYANQWNTLHFSICKFWNKNFQHDVISFFPSSNLFHGVRFVIFKHCALFSKFHLWMRLNREGRIVWLKRINIALNIFFILFLTLFFAPYSLHNLGLIT